MYNSLVLITDFIHLHCQTNYEKFFKKIHILISYFIIKLRKSEFTRWQAKFSRGVARILQACNPNSPENGPGRVCYRAEFT